MSSSHAAALVLSPLPPLVDVPHPTPPLKQRKKARKDTDHAKTLPRLHFGDTPEKKLQYVSLRSVIPFV